MLDKATVVVMTHNRHHLLDSVVLPHFTKMGIALMIIDSSAEPHQNSIDAEGVDYVHCPNEPLPYKLEKPILERVKTPYMLMHTDDTLTSPKGIVKSIEFLEKNEDYSTAYGLTFQTYYGDFDRVSADSLEWVEMKCDSDRPEVRPMLNYVQFRSTFYAVHRMECWRKVYQYLHRDMVNCYLNESYMVMMALIHGKSAHLPFLYSVTMAGPSLYERDKRFYCSPYKLALDQRYAGEVEATKQSLTKYLMERSGLQEDVSRRYVEAALALYWLRDRDAQDFNKTLASRIKKEWRAFVNKTFRKAEMKRAKAERDASNLQKDKKNTARALELIGEEGRKEYAELMDSIKRNVVF